MKKFLAFLLTLAMMMQLVALQVVAEESVTTPTDLQLPCESCGGIAVWNGWTRGIMYM